MHSAISAGKIPCTKLVKIFQFSIFHVAFVDIKKFKKKKTKSRNILQLNRIEKTATNKIVRI